MELINPRDRHQSNNADYFSKRGNRMRPLKRPDDAMPALSVRS